MSDLKSNLEKIVGKGSVLVDEVRLNEYSGDQSFVAPRKPDAVVFVDTVEQIQALIRHANKTLIPIIPYSSGKNLHGATIPDQGGIILNLSNMNRIIEIDEENWFAVIEPGVTYRQLQDTLLKKGFRVMVPFGCVPERSVLSSYLERDPVLAAPSFEHGNSLILDTELVLPDGELFRTGNWASGGRPGAPNGPIRNTLSRLWTGSQGTLGVLTKMVVQIEPVPQAQKFFFIPFPTLADAVEPLQRIQRKEIGTECFLLNNFNLAALFTDTWDIPNRFPVESIPSPDFEQLRRLAPSWVLTVCINGPLRRTEEKISYEVEALEQLCDILNVELLESLPHIPAAQTTMRAEMLRPWSILKKFNYKGTVHDLSFKAPLKKIAALEKTLLDQALKKNYPLDDIGMYLLPLERGRGLHCEFDLHCRQSTPSDGAEWEQVKALWLQASAELINCGAYFDRPYGAWAHMVYARAGNYTQMLRKLKSETDPNNILNPGKLCFT